MAANPHAEKAKELLTHYLQMAASGDAGDPDEAATIIDHIIDAVHFEIHRELKSVFDGIGEGRKAAAEMKDKPNL